jgi:hypothetical protein
MTGHSDVERSGSIIWAFLQQQPGPGRSRTHLGTKKPCPSLWATGEIQLLPLLSDAA